MAASSLAAADTSYIVRSAPFPQGNPFGNPLRQTPARISLKNPREDPLLEISRKPTAENPIKKAFRATPPGEAFAKDLQDSPREVSWEAASTDWLKYDHDSLDHAQLRAPDCCFGLADRLRCPDCSGRIRETKIDLFGIVFAADMALYPLASKPSIMQRLFRKFASASASAATGGSKQMLPPGRERPPVCLTELLGSLERSQCSFFLRGVAWLLTEPYTRFPSGSLSSSRNFSNLTRSVKPRSPPQAAPPRRPRQVSL